MVSQYTILGTALLFLAIFYVLGSVSGDTAAKTLKQLYDEAVMLPGNTPGTPHWSGVTHSAHHQTDAAGAADATAAPGADTATGGATEAPGDAATVAPHAYHTTGANGAHHDSATGAPSAAPAFAAAPQHVQLMGSPGIAGGHGAGLGASAMVGIGVGVGVACLVAVGAVVGVLVHLRRRKRKGTPLEKQKTYGGTE